MTTTEVQPRSTPRRRLTTGLLVTELHLEQGKAVWTRRLGAQAPLDFSPTQNPSAENQRQHIVWGEGTATFRSYATTAGTTVAEQLQQRSPKDMHRMGQLWGEALNNLHATPITGPTTLREPRTLQRAEGWLSGKWLPALHTLGPMALGQLKRWSQRMLGTQDSALAHGSPGMAHWVLTANGRSGSLLTGEDTGLAAPAYDFGWVLGEIAELYAFYPALRTNLDPLRLGLLNTYPEAIGESGFSLACAYRLTQHAYDWHHYGHASLREAQLLLDLAVKHVSTQYAKL